MDNAWMDNMFKDLIDESIRKRMAWKDSVSADEEASPPPRPGDETKKIPVVELFDDDDESVTFEVLDELEYEDAKYELLTPYYETEEGYDLNSPADVFVMKMVETDNDEPMIETVEDEALFDKIYSVFKKTHPEFEYRND